MGSFSSYDVFLSYSSKDLETVRELAKQLRRDKLNVWFDESVGATGSTSIRIEEVLDSSRVFVLCMSAAAKTEWPRTEDRTYAFRDPINLERKFILLRLDSAPIPASLEHFVFVDWRPENRAREYGKLLKACRSVAIKSAPHSSIARSASIATKLANSITSYAYAFDLDGSQVLTADRDGVLKLWDLEKGLCLHKFGRDKARSENIAWSPDKGFVLKAGPDNVLELWNVETGECFRGLRGHTDRIWGVTWSADQRFALSASFDKTIRLWDVETGEWVRVFRGHAERVRNVVWNPDQRRVLSCSDDNTLRLWDVQTGKCLRVLEGHNHWVMSVAWSANARFVLSGSCDNTMRLWDIQTGKCLRMFEGHTSNVEYLAWSPDQSSALSGSPDKTVRVWDVNTGRCLRILTGSTSFIRGLAWSADQRQVLAGDFDGNVFTWDLFIEGEKNRPSVSGLQALEPQTQYTNAKVLLVGDTGVGKSGLAKRLVHDQFVPTKSSHGREAHVLDSTVVERPGGVSLHRETVLWDLAGQPAYRSVHQLSMDDAALACVLFDSRSETNPFEGAAYWSQVLSQARTNTKLKKILVASRIDVGGLPASRERIEEFAAVNGFVRFIPTSASTGDGCAELLDAIRNEIPWDDLPTLSTTKTLAEMRDYIAIVKEQNEAVGAERARPGTSAKLVTIASLYEGFVALVEKGIHLSDFVVHLQRLEASDSVGLLIFRTTGAEPKPEDLVLLDPTRIDAYSSALLVASKDEPDGPGHLLESRVREGQFRLDEDERIADRGAERHVLWYVMEKLLSRDLALRERIKGEDYIVFPSQCTAELRFPGGAAFGVSFGFSGLVRSIYARLVAHLAHYEGFKKREFFQDAAAYHADAGGRCLIHVIDHGRGQGELEVFYDSETPTSVRQGFLEFIGKQLESKGAPGSVSRRYAYHCVNPMCRNAFEDRVVKARVHARKRTLLCPICEKKTPLIDLLASPTQAAESVASQMDRDATAGRHRMTAALVIRAKEAEGKFDVFLSYNSKDKAAVEKIAKQLVRVGLRPWFDKWNLSPGDTVSDALEAAIESIPCAMLCFGPADTGKWHIMEIRAYVERWASKDARLIPVILPDVKDVPPLPLFVRQTLWVDMRDWEDPDSDAFYRLVCGILGRAPGESPIRKLGVRHVAEWQGATR